MPAESEPFSLCLSHPPATSIGNQMENHSEKKKLLQMPILYFVYVNKIPFDANRSIDIIVNLVIPQSNRNVQSHLILSRTCFGMSSNHMCICRIAQPVIILFDVERYFHFDIRLCSYP